MTLEMISGLLIVVSIIFILTLPFNFLFFRFLRELIKLLKELKTDYKRIAAEAEAEEAVNLEENFTEYIQKQQEKQAKGAFRYYFEKLKKLLNRYGVWLYTVIAVMIVGGILLSPLVSGLQEISANSVENPKHVALIFLPVELILFIIYWSSKTDKRKWQVGLMLIFTLFLGMIWELAITDTAKAYGNLFLIFLMMITVIHHYKRWKQECDQKILEV